MMQPLNPELSALLDHWQRLRGHDRMPGRELLRAEDLRRWWGHLIVASPVEDAGRIRFRIDLIGTAITGWDGRELTGRFIDELFDEPLLRDQMVTPYRRAFDTRRPVAMTMRGPGDGPFSLVQRLVMPFAGSYGVAKLLGAVYVREVLDWGRADNGRAVLREGRHTAEVFEFA